MTQINLCASCGLCRAQCPSLEAGALESTTARGRIAICDYLLRNDLEITDTLVDRIFSCPICGLCKVNCPPEVDPLKIIEAARIDLVKGGKAPPDRQRAFGMHIGNEHNPYMELHKDRLAWLRGDIKIPEKAFTVYFVGCTSSYRQKNLAKATVEVFNRAGVDFTILRDEWCCASPLLRTGQLETDWVSVKEIAQHNISEAKKARAERIVTTCAGCYRTWKMDYLGEEYGALLDAKHHFEVLHTMEVLEQLIKDGKMQFEREVRMRVTYHDPCHLGRHAGLYESPRSVLEAIPGLELVEMPRTRENAWCCGAGGGVKSGYPEWSLEIAGERVREAEELGVDAIVSACPFCWRNFDDAIKKFASKLKMYDIIELVNQASKPGCR